MTFAYPLGFLALLGIPAVLLIHFLQRQSKTVTVSTLFLLDQMRRESVKGRRFERIRSSVPLWLQLLMVLALTWLLIGPQWTRPNTVQQIAIVLDSSASMSAFRDRVEDSLIKELARLSDATARAEIAVIDSRIAEEPIYTGTDLAELATVLKDEWAPTGGEHDFGPALRVARSLVGADGLVILTTDHAVEDISYNAVSLSIGEPRANVGFAGLTTEVDESGDLRWKATVRNYSEEVQNRSYYLLSSIGRTDDRAITLEPHEIRLLQGIFPPDADVLTLEMSADDFTLDDRLPIVRPKPKPFYVGRVSDPKLDQTLVEIVESLGEEVSAPVEGEPTDLMLVTYDPFSPTKAIPPNSLIFLRQRSAPKKFLKGRIVAANHPLVADLNWQGLIARDSPEIPHDDVIDNTLVWQGDRSLIILRTAEGKRQLLFNFDLGTSNATRLPAFVVLLHRFTERLRNIKIAPETLNLEIGQPIDLALNTQPTDAEGNAIDTDVEYSFTEEEAGALTETTKLTVKQAQIIRAPNTPGFLQIRQNDTVLLKAATHFADTREADLSEAADVNNLPNTSDHLVEKNATQQNPWQIWLIALLVVLIASWYFINRKPVSGTPEATA